MTTEVPKSIVIDNGSDYIRAGISRETKPKVVFPTIVGSNDKGTFVGDDAQAIKDQLNIQHPIVNGIITNFDDMEKIWRYTIEKSLQTTSTDQQILLTEKPFNPRENREKTVQIMFETFNTKATYLAIQPVLATYAAGRLTGICIDCGANVSHVVPVVNGFAVVENIEKLEIGGCDLTEYMIKLLKEKNIQLEPNQRNIAKDIKEKLCYVAMDYNAELQKQIQEKTYELPDGKNISIGNEQFKCPEALFQPNLIDKQCNGIHTSTHDVIMKSNENVREELYKNIIISGGSSLINNFTERYTEEIKKGSNGKEVEVIAPLERSISTWIGASILTALPTFQNLWITKADYEEKGASIVHTKCAAEKK